MEKSIFFVPLSLLLTRYFGLNAGDALSDTKGHTQKSIWIPTILVSKRSSTSHCGMELLINTDYQLRILYLYILQLYEVIAYMIYEPREYDTI